MLPLLRSFELAVHLTTERVTPSPKYNLYDDSVSPPFFFVMQYRTVLWHPRLETTLACAEATFYFSMSKTIRSPIYNFIRDTKLRHQRATERPMSILNDKYNFGFKIYRMIFMISPNRGTKEQIQVFPCTSISQHKIYFRVFLCGLVFRSFDDCFYDLYTEVRSSTRNLPHQKTRREHNPTHKENVRLR